MDTIEENGNNPLKNIVSKVIKKIGKYPNKIPEIESVSLSGGDSSSSDNSNDVYCSKQIAYNYYNFTHSNTSEQKPTLSHAKTTLSNPKSINTINTHANARKVNPDSGSGGPVKRYNIKKSDKKKNIELRNSV